MNVTRKELDQAIEMATINWHRHGDEELESLIELMERLYSEGSEVATSAAPGRINWAWLKSDLQEELLIFLAPDEVATEMWLLEEKLLDLGATAHGDYLEPLFFESFEEAFRERYNENDFESELAERLWQLARNRYEK